MYEHWRDFLASSPVAERVKLPARVVIQRTGLTPRELAGIREQGRYGPVPEEEETCELEVGVQVLARGRTVRRGREWFFQVKEVLVERKGGGG